MLWIYQIDAMVSRRISSTWKLVLKKFICILLASEFQTVKLLNGHYKCILKCMCWEEFHWKITKQCVPTTLSSATPFQGDGYAWTVVARWPWQWHYMIKSERRWYVWYVSILKVFSLSKCSLTSVKNLL